MCNVSVTPHMQFQLAQCINRAMAHSFHSHVCLSSASLTQPYCLQGWKWAPWSCGAYRSDGEIQGQHHSCQGFECLQYYGAALTMGAAMRAAQLWQRAGRKGVRAGTGEKRTQGRWEGFIGAGVTPPEMVGKHKPWYLGGKQLCVAGLTPKAIHCWVFLMFLSC